MQQAIKHKKSTYFQGDDLVKITIYNANFVYTNDTSLMLDYILFEEGNISMQSETPEFQYFLKDHLGNTMVIFNEKSEIIQMHDYYPFGLESANREGGDVKYRYNGKELQDDQIGGVGLDWYDYGARMYDPALGRWHVTDPMADSAYSWSVYRYSFNNPISYIDPNGMLETKYITENNELLFESIDGSDDVITVSAEKVEDFKELVSYADEPGMKEVYDSKEWNDNMKADFLGFETIQDMENSLSYTSSQFSRQAKIDLIQGNGNLLEFGLIEVGSQLANPLNHIPTPINFKTKVPVKNSWVKFNRQMGRGKFIKKIYGSSKVASKARTKAYQEFKSKNNE